MVWWQWIVLGVLLLGAEMLVDAEFYLVFLGLSAVVVGTIDVLWPGSPIWAEWLLFSAIAIAALLVFRGRFYQKLRGEALERSEGVVGEVGSVEADIAPGAVGRIELRGTTWSARNVGEQVLRRGARARVDSTSGLTVDVRTEES
ncbi:MAG: NfeD family protein [Deltaproteobacteria bacterium]|nr:NfeD family protein [Deltaproteobacteria bacterium]MBW2417827.1 NfeD family protein [Deltaproteobacteria bacterium]